MLKPKIDVSKKIGVMDFTTLAHANRCELQDILQDSLGMQKEGSGDSVKISRLKQVKEIFSQYWQFRHYKKF